MATNLVLPCQANVIKGRIEVRVKRRNPSKKKGTIGKQLPDIALELREVGNDTVLATSKSKGKKDCAVFDTNIDPTKQYVVKAVMKTGRSSKTKTGPFGPPQKFGTFRKTDYRTAQVEIWLHQYEYQMKFKLGDVDSIFANAKNTRLGRMERLQVLGLLPRPLDHSEVGACFDYVWGTYMKRLVSGSDDPLVHAGIDDGAMDTAIETWLPEFLVENSEFPAPGAFAKIRASGDYRVFHRDFDEKYFKEPEFTLARGVRYDVEQRFLQANPALGKIPLTVVLERREENSADPWKAAPNKLVRVQLLPPDTLPAYGGPGGPKELVGANTWTAQVTGAPIRAVAGKALKSSRKAKHGGPGPLGYLKRHVTERKGDPGFASPNKNDPQKDNVWVEFGGKRRMATDMRNVTTAGAAENIFSLNDLGQFRTKNALTAPAAAGDLKADPYSVEMRTNAAGVAGVIFAPSLIGGDRYKLRAYFDTSKKPRAEAKTGTMVRWRTMRVARSLSVTPPGAKAGLHASIKSELEAYYGECDHKEMRYCGECLLREGTVVEMDFKGFLTKEFSKSYCEILVDKTAVQPAHKVIDKACLDRAVAALQLEQENGDQQGGIVEWNESFRQNAGTVVGSLKGKGTIMPKTVKVMVDQGGSTSIVLIDDGNGNFTGTGKQAISGQVFRGIGTIDYATGAFNITFQEGVPTEATVKIFYKLGVALDLESLIYWADNSPFLFNIHTPQAYNSIIDPAEFTKLPTQFSVTKELLGTGDDTIINFEKQLPAGLVTYKVQLDGADLKDKVVATLSPTSKLTISDTEEVVKTIGFDTKAAVIGTFTATLTEDPAATSMMIVVSSLSRADKDEDRKEDGLAIVRRTGVAQITGTQRGLSVTWDGPTRKLTVTFAQEGADKVSAIKLKYSKPKALPAGQKLTIDYTAAEVYDNTTPKPVAGGLGKPGSQLDAHLSKMISFYLMIKLIRAIDGDNGGFMPGLIGLQAPLRDTWSSIYDPNGLHQGKGICNGFFVFYGNRWRNAPVDDLNTFDQLSLHEMSHCLYLNHFPSGNPFGGGSRADLHDMFDNCMMGYGKNESDLCGKCVAAFMGVNTSDARLGTWNGTSYVKNDSALTSAQDDIDTPAGKKHVEPPLLAAPEPAKDADDIMSLLLNCPVGKQVWDLALDVNGGAEPEISNSGPTGTGMCQIIPAIIAFPTIARVEFHSETEKQQLLSLGGEFRVTDTKEELVQFIGDWVGVQILIMELGNLTKRYDFFDLDYRMQKGDAGLEEYVKETERLEYLGGVTYVINAYNRCKDYWQAPVCQKASSMNSTKTAPMAFDEYYDGLPETHKGKYYGEWHEKGMLPFYLKNTPRLRALAPIRVEKILHTVKHTFGSGDTWIVPKPPMNLFSDDDACWTLLNTMFGLDPDWDVDARNRVLDWTKQELAMQTSPDAMVRVGAIAGLARTNPPNLT
ncbi:MAG: hypothetical protein NTV52_10580 [Acidobacteria bacterium]|nr:hypothetical protein [Acidobacteriota bacterium]